MGFTTPKLHRPAVDRNPPHFKAFGAADKRARMYDERLDKQWLEKGLKGYSTKQILGTLEHYGVHVDPTSFRAQAAISYPLTIAQSWQNLWKGTGKFAKLPALAVEELWRRLTPEVLQPLDIVEGLTNLLGALMKLRKRQHTAPVDPQFEAFEALLKRMPEDKEDRRDHFMAEVVMVLSGSLETLDLMAEGLAKDGQVAVAERFVAVEEQLFPVRKGVSSALVLAAKGDRAAALAQLSAIADDSKRDDYARMSAIDALMHLKAGEQAMPSLSALGDAADAANDGELLQQLDRRWHAMVDAVSGAAQSQAVQGLRLSHQRTARFGGHGH